MSEQLKIGQVQTEKHGRDAIHIAVVQVIAGASLYPGDKVILNKNGKALPACSEDKYVGIVDPYIDDDDCVLEGDVFWLLLKPGSVTSLRHEWTHPAFTETPVDTAVKANNSAAEARAALAKPVLEKYASRFKVTLNTLLRELGDMDEYGYCRDDNDCGGDIEDELWDAYEQYVGYTVTDRAKYFTCSC